MKITRRGNNSARPSSLESPKCAEKSCRKGGRLSRVRAATKFGTRLVDATERAACDLHREGIERTPLGRFHEAADENSSRLLCPLERVLRARRGRPRPLPLARLGFEAAEDGYMATARSIHGGKPRRMLRVEIERRAAGKRSAAARRRGNVRQ